MRNPVLHDALRSFALEAAALLSADQGEGAEVVFDVVDEVSRGGSRLYRYEARTGQFIADRWPRIRELDTFPGAASELGAGAAAWLRMSGLRGEQAEPALQAMLERLYEDATSFGFPEERFERVYREVELTLYRDAVRSRVIAPLPGAWMEAERVNLGGGLSLVRGDRFDAPPEAVWPEEEAGPTLLCMLERDMSPGDFLPASEAEERFRRLVGVLRLWSAGAVSLGTPGWHQADGGRWSPLPLGDSGVGRGPGWLLPAGHERALCEFAAAMAQAAPTGVVGWALARFEMGCERNRDAEALSDYLLALRALLDATSDAGEASLALRLAVLCAEEGNRRLVQRRVQAALALERHLMGGAGALPGDSPRELVAEVEGHVRALLRDVLCGYLDHDLKGLADDILLETAADPTGDIEARDLRREPEPDTAEIEAVQEEEPPRAAPPPAAAPTPAPPPAAAPPPVDGVTSSIDFSPDEPEDFSAPI
jgi:hypothetical protein